MAKTRVKAIAFQVVDLMLIYLNKMIRVGKFAQRRFSHTMPILTTLSRVEKSLTADYLILAPLSKSWD